MINYHRVLETDQYWGDVNYLGVVEAQGSILRSSSMWMVSESAFFTIEVTQCSIRNSCDVSFVHGWTMQVFKIGCHANLQTQHTLVSN